MSSELQTRTNRSRLMFDYSEIDAKETSKAWNRFLSDRGAPSMPMSGVRSVIFQSWVRSNSTGIKPEQYAAPTLDSAPLSRKSKHDNSDMRRATQKSLSQIGEMLSGAEAILLLTDRDGVILDTVGDSSTLDKANRINLRVGGIWSEQASGTNGIGTALWTGQPVFVHGEEHFCEGMKAWSCACAPIRDPVDHSIIGAINLSGLTAIFQRHNAAFAATAAREIEMTLEREQSILNRQLLEAIIGTVPMQTGGVGEGIAVVDRFGRLIFNRNCQSIEQFSASGSQIKPGAKLLDLQAEISESSILSALPADHSCQEIRLINVDGAVKGAALVFKPSKVARRGIVTRLPALPGITIRGSELTIVGKSEAILEALDSANRAASAKLPILIEGQTGVGKELFARLIHSQMDPANRLIFAPINCGAISHATLDQGLNIVGQSGSRADQSAPTPADAHSRILILDEIGELPAGIQPYLLRVLEECSVGTAGNDAAAVAMRVISLTNRTMLDEVAAGRFRKDLFYRLGSITLTIPPLTDRGDDILLISEHYNRRISAESGRDLLVLRSDVQEALMTHAWPGNVRELRNVISGLHVMAKNRIVTLMDLPREVMVRKVASLAQAEPPLQPDQSVPALVALKDTEAMMIRTALTAHHGNLSRVASVLGISRPTLYRKMQSYGIASNRAN